MLVYKPNLYVLMFWQSECCKLQVPNLYINLKRMSLQKDYVKLAIKAEVAHSLQMIFPCKAVTRNLETLVLAR